MLAVGDSLPPFSLLNQAGERVTQENFGGHYSVLYFYPRDNTPGCTTEACDFTDEISYFKSLNVPVYGVSPDSVASHVKFVKSKELKIDLLADEEHGLCEKCGVWAEKKMYGKTFMGVVRTTFLINQEGVIVQRFDKVKVKGHVVEVKKCLASLIKD